MASGEVEAVPVRARAAGGWGVRRTTLWALGFLLFALLAIGSWATLAEGRLASSDWRSLVAGGLARGSVYAIIAVGYTLVYGILFIINFAHGEVFMAGAFTSFFVARDLGESGFLNENPIIGILICIGVAAATSTTVAVLLERMAYRPLRGAPRLVPLITAIGASLFLQYTFRGLFGPQTRGYPNVEALDGEVNLLGISIGKAELLAIIGAFLLMAGLYYFVNRTKAGRAMRAVGEDREIASLMGIDVDRTIVTTFAIGGMLAGAAGVLWALNFGQVSFQMGFLPGIKAFTAAVLGGIGSIAGAALGGVVVGVLEAVAPPLLLGGIGVKSLFQLTDVIAFSILVLVLIFRPGGLLGSAEAEKV
ncbi:MAG TPA: branched-chain amino acid ABC transporter permease [Actinomycetota bacterium]|nr:branched-chain amino acid ABC transporter permease [Actinomycetota bacterium]